MVIHNEYSTYKFLLVEPIAKTPYPPLGLMKISSMLRSVYKNCIIESQVGNLIPKITEPKNIYITSLFTWDLRKVVDSIKYYRRLFPSSNIKVGGTAATIYPDFITKNTGIEPHIGIFNKAEDYSPDYAQNFGRKLNTSITFTSRGCIRKCEFCAVPKLEPKFFIKENWISDINNDFPNITIWDNNWLASSNLKKDCKILKNLGKKVDFNQGLDARLYTKDIAMELSYINIDPIRFAFDDINQEKYILKAIKLAKKYNNNEIRVYVLYNFKETPENFYYRINLLNKEKVLSFPMEYRDEKEIDKKFPGPNWNKRLLRALKLSLIFYYRKGMSTDKIGSCESIYGKNSKEFIRKLYEIYKYDKNLRKKRKMERINA